MTFIYIIIALAIGALTAVGLLVAWRALKGAVGVGHLLLTAAAGIFVAVQALLWCGASQVRDQLQARIDNANALIATADDTAAELVPQVPVRPSALVRLALPLLRNAGIDCTDEGLTMEGGLAQTFSTFMTHRWLWGGGAAAAAFLLGLAIPAPAPSRSTRGSRGARTAATTRHARPVRHRSTAPSRR